MEKLNVSKQEYKTLVEKASPNSHIFTDCVKAFIVGGIICTIGQLINTVVTNCGASKDNASMYTTVALVFAASLLTGLGLYGKLGKFAGAGSVVPITGFSNSITAPAIEFKKEGLILGVGAKMFLVAGPVIVYGTFSSIIMGILYYIFK